LNIVAPEVIKELSSFANKLYQPIAGMEVPLVVLHVKSEFVDSLRQQRDLDLGRAGIHIVKTEVTYYLSLLVFR
jgi:hypothetical protein